MTDHTFDLAAALVDTALTRLATPQYGTTHILFHEFGQFPLTASHTVHDTGHTVRITAYDDHGVLAAAQAHATNIDETPTGRIVLFRAGHLRFIATATAGDDKTTFLAQGAHPYLLTATAGSAQWRVSIGDGALEHFEEIAQALDYILTQLEPAHSV
jgi:hypothetical protein